MNGKVVVVTGAAGGIGAATITALVARGARVIAGDVQEVSGSDSVVPVTLDVTDPQDWSRLATLAREEFGRVDGLVNSAGVTSRVRIGDVELSDWNRVFEVNVTGPMLGTQAMMPLMDAGGSIVNICSLAALIGHYTTAYTASKWALRGLTQTCASELGPRGIRVNAVHPGFIETPMTATYSEAFLNASLAITPLGRAGSPEEVANVITFLLSDESAYVSGAEISIDGATAKGGIAKFVADSLR